MLLTVTGLILLWDLYHLWRLVCMSRRGGIDPITGRRLLQLRRLYALLFTAPVPLFLYLAFAPVQRVPIGPMRQVALCHLLMMGDFWFGFLTLKQYLPQPQRRE